MVFAEHLVRIFHLFCFWCIFFLFYHCWRLMARYQLPFRSNHNAGLPTVSGRAHSFPLRFRQCHLRIRLSRFWGYLPHARMSDLTFLTIVHGRSYIAWTEDWERWRSAECADMTQGRCTRAGFPYAPSMLRKTPHIIEARRIDSIQIMLDCMQRYVTSCSSLHTTFASHLCRSQTSMCCSR